MSEPYYNVKTLQPMKSIGFLIKRCGVMMSQLAERRFESQQVSFTQSLVLLRLSFQAHMSATRLSEELGHDMGALTRVVDSLERSGFVRRERSQQDRRAVEIAITAEGRREVERCMHFLVDLMNELVEPWSKPELDSFIGQLQRLMLRLQEYVERSKPSAAAAPTDPPPAAPRRRKITRGST